jgi:hypothetical protein
MYENLFKTLFQLVAGIGMSQHQDGVKWIHIHNVGIEAVILDMCHKQASGK